jgi:glutamine synthetase
METANAVALVDEFFAAHPEVRFIRLQWVDYSGVLRTRAITKVRCKALADGTDHYSLVQNCMVIPISTAPRCFPDGIEPWRLQPDWSSLTVCGFDPKNASVMCFIAHLGLEDPFARCPRKLLSRLLDTIQEQHHGDARLLLGFEIEFVLLDPASTDLSKPTDRVVAYSMTTGLHVLEDIVAKLEVSNIPVHHFHTEVEDQFEIALSPLPPMQAIDALMMAQEAIRVVCQNHKLKATTAPRPVIGGPPNGCHVHLSINPALETPSFLAGVLEKLKPLCFFGLANYDSYHRVTGYCVGEWVGWGVGNKDLPVAGVSQNHWEFRFLDATANVYLFIAALLAAGMAGVQDKRPLCIPNCQVIPSMFTLEEAERRLREYGITERVPATLEQSLSAAKDDPDVQKWLGRELFTQYLKVKEKELEYFSKMPEEERRQKVLGYF